ncbi:hypothetical protein F4805DRAFT_290597 [Annulohypoxylon moriforme]|nr:hypothetical protein F4805DRAFT_290597 [Annulohypoxylon moriforme]
MPSFIEKRAPAQLQIVDYERIRQRDPAELVKLLQACRPPANGGRGVFYLDLRGPTAHQTLINLNATYDGTLQYFQQPHNKKMEDLCQSDERGYKPGESFETLEINHDEYVFGTRKLPAVLKPFEADMGGLISSCDTIVRDLMSVLLVDPSSRGENPANKPNDTGLKICLQAAHFAPWEVTGHAHTDMGVLSLLFYNAATMELPALPSTDASAENWELIEPVDGCVVVNVADTLQRMSGGEFHSPVHRVVQPDNVPETGTPIIIYYLRDTGSGARVV